jgi:hypothetical protein
MKVLPKRSSWYRTHLPPQRGDAKPVQHESTVTPRE